MIKHTTIINEVCRKGLGISRDEYALCQYAHYRAADPRQKNTGWCCDKKEYVADFIGITRAGIYKMIDKVSRLGLIEVDSANGYFRATSFFIDAENFAQKQKKDVNKVYSSSDAHVNKVDTDCKQSLHEHVNKVTVNIEGIERVKKEERDNARLTSPMFGKEQANVTSTLEAKSPPIPPIAPTPLSPRHSDKPQSIETDAELFAQIGQYYKANANEWIYGVCEVLPGRYTGVQLKSMLEDYCGFAFANKNKYATFAQHHAEFKRWVKRQPTMQKEQAAQPAADVTKNLKRFI